MRGLTRIKSRRARFFVAFATVLIGGLLVGWMFMRAWVAGPLDNPLLVFLKNMGISQYLVAALVAGAYLGVSLPLLFDRMKRVQGVFLVVVWAGVMALLHVFEVIVPFWSIVELVALVAALGLGALYGGILQVFDDSHGELHFRRANRGIVTLTILLVAIGLVEAHLDISYLLKTPIDQVYIDEATFGLLFIPLDLFGGALLIVMLNIFVGYEDKRAIMVVGPSRVGKTHFTVGLYHVVDAEDGTTSESEALARSHDRLLNTGKWLPASEETQRLWFEYIHGVLHKRKRTISLFDYPGEIFRHIPVAYEVGNPRVDNYKSLVRARIQEKILESPSESNDEMQAIEREEEQAQELKEEQAQELAENYSNWLVDSNFMSEFWSADTVLLLLDLQEFRKLIGEEEKWSALGETDEEKRYDWEPQSQSRADGWGESEESQNLADDLDDDDVHIPVSTYGALQSKIGGSKTIGLVVTKASAYENDVGYKLEGNYSRYQDFISNKLKQHGSIKRLVERADIGPFPVFLHGDEDGPDTGGPGRVTLMTYGIKELKEVLEQ